jgi:hypothetical protein
MQRGSTGAQCEASSFEPICVLVQADLAVAPLLVANSH